MSEALKIETAADPLKEFICGICHEIIKIGEEYCILATYDVKWDFKKAVHYHVRCYREYWVQHNKVDYDAKIFMSRAFALLDKLEKRTD